MSDGGRGNLELILAFLLGAAAGATVALLTAPQSGRETRDRIKDLARGAADDAKRVPSTLSDAYGRAARAAREAFLRALDDTTGSSGPAH